MAMNIPVVVNGGWGDVEMMVNKHSVFDRDFLKFENLINVRAAVRDLLVENLSLNTGISRYEEVYRRLA